MLETFKGRALLATVLILIGFGLGMSYVVASGARGPIAYFECKVIWIGEEPSLTPDGRIRLEEQAIDLALSNPRVKELIEGKQYRVVAAFYISGRYEIGPKEGEYTILRFEWDGKLRTLVTIIFADDSGYYVDVNLTDGIVEDIRYTSNVFPTQ